MSTIEQNIKKLNIWYLTIFKDELQHPEDAIYDLSCQQKSKKGKIFYHQVLIYDKLVTFNELKKLYPSARLQKRKSISSVLKTIDYKIELENVYPKSFVVYRLAKDKMIEYSSSTYQKYNFIIERK